MLKRKLCEARFEWKLACEGPLLISDGRYDKDQLPEAEGKWPNMIFISHSDKSRIYQAVQAATSAEALRLPFYVPGTSLRGPFRAQAERIIRTLLPETASPPLTACDPFSMDEQEPKSCSKRIDLTKPAVPYAVACPACKLFGCTGTASRITFADAKIQEGYRSVYRDMIGIDRFTGGVHSGANMEFHALEGATFTTRIVVANFELWHLGLIAYVFRDFEQGLVPIGFGKTKGFGAVTGEVKNVLLTYPIGRTSGQVHHMGSLASDSERERYGLHASEAPKCDLAKVATGGLSLYETFSVSDAAKISFWESVAGAFNDFIEKKIKEAAA